MFIVCLEHIFLMETLYLKDKDKDIFTPDKEQAVKLTEEQVWEYIERRRKIGMYDSESMIYIQNIS